MIILKKGTKYAGLILVLLSLFLYLKPAASVYAQNLELTSDVPLNVELEVIIYGEGTVKVGSIELVSSATIFINRNTKTEVYLLSDRDYTIGSVILNDEDISRSVNNNNLVLPELNSRSVLEIYFVYEALMPYSGEETDNLLLPFLLITASLVVSTLLVDNKLRIQSKSK